MHKFIIITIIIIYYKYNKALKRVVLSGDRTNVLLSFQTPSYKRVDEIIINLVCDSMMGIDVNKSVAISLD